MRADVDELVTLLEWYEHAGVDFMLGETPVDRFEESRAELARRTSARLPTRQSSGEGTDAAPRRPPAPGPLEGVPLPPVRPGEARRTDNQVQPIARPAATASVPSGNEVMAARAAAASAKSLDELKSILAGFGGCNLRQTARSLVFADGNPQGRIMLIGEAPGREEDETGLPFVGRSGQLLDRMLAAIGLDRTSVYIANVVPWRPPGNRTPTPQETEICKPFIVRQVELANPEFIVFLGGAAAAALAGTTEGILKLRGRWLDYPLGETKIPALATLHPAYLLRQPLQKRLAWRDFRDLKRKLDALHAKPR
jgi:DNA polymerase